jgi:hypothetical protein
MRSLASGTAKFFGFDVAPWLVAGGLTMAATTTANGPLGAVAGIAGLIGCSSGRELWQKAKSLIDEKNKIKRSPVALLYSAAKGVK